MARYTESVVVGIQHAYENTDQPLHSIGADFHVAGRTVQRLATERGWKKRSERVRGLPEEMQLLERATALAAAASPPAATHTSIGEADRVAVAAKETPSPTLPLAGGGSSPAPVAASEQTLAAADEIEAVLREKVAAERAAQSAIKGSARPSNADSERSARTLATLTRTLHVLARIRAGKSIEPETLNDDDDKPFDIDEFRFELARRIDAFVASRTDPADGDGDRADRPVEDVQ